MQVNVAEYWLDFVDNNVIRNKTAVIQSDKETTFGELFDRAGIIGARLIEKFHAMRRPIAVFLPKCAEQMAADMGVIYSGNAYSNLDIKQPIERTKRIIENINPLCIITFKSLSANLDESVAAKADIICLEDVFSLTYDVNIVRERLKHIVDTDPLCIINTSGSTGTPKGVIMNHRSIIDFLDHGTETLHIGYGEVIGSLSPVYFDIFTLEFYLTLWKQCVFVCIPDNLALFPEKLIEFLAKKRVELIFWVPTVMVNIANLDILANYDLPNLKKVLFAGEVFPVKHLSYWMKYLPQTEFINMYGPIEITVDCLYHKVTTEDIEHGELPIGKAFPNTKMYVLNENDKECNVNEQGELCIGGTSLAMGYYNDPEKTEKAFVQNPLNPGYREIIYRTGDMVYIREDGNVMFVGRKDFQIKHLGYRIELSEIEAVSVSLQNVNNACVLYDKENKKIILVYESTKDISLREWRESIGKILPKYMLPTVCHKIDKMPINANGKIDRKKLKEKFAKG